MYEIAIVEDNENDRNQIMSFLQKFFERTGKVYNVSQFPNAINFLTNYKPMYDMVFLDVQMPHMDGMEAAKRLREVDGRVPLAFITNMSNFAVRGYSVNATDFLVKPMQYATFRAMMTKLLAIVDNSAKQIVLKTPERIMRVDVNSIRYVDVFRHQVTYHTESGEYPSWTSLKEEGGKLPADCFIKINNYCLLNLKFVEEIRGSEVLLRGGEVLLVSRSKKSTLIKAYLAYCGKYL